jgi:hypothetical protein
VSGAKSDRAFRVAAKPAMTLDEQPTLTRPTRTERVELGTGRVAVQVWNTRANFARPRN